MAADWRKLYPFESHWLDLDGIRYHYLDEGPRDAPPVVMVHGNPTWSFYYRTLIPAISQSHRVIVPDHIGCGLSDKPQEYPYTLAQHIANLEKLIAHLGLQNLTLVMHDWGGAISMGYATRHPENVARFVVFNTSAFYQPVSPILLRLARAPFLGDFAVRGLNAFAGLAVILGMSHHERMTPEVKAGYLAPYDNWRNRVAVLRFVQDIPFEAPHPTRKTIAEIENKLHLFRQHPMLIIWGSGDFIFTERDFLTGWQARFPKAQVHVFKDAGHYVVEDAHERIAPLVVNFLNPPAGL